MYYILHRVNKKKVTRKAKYIYISIGKIEIYITKISIIENL